MCYSYFEYDVAKCVLTFIAQLHELLDGFWVVRPYKKDTTLQPYTIPLHCPPPIWYLIG